MQPTQHPDDALLLLDLPEGCIVDIIRHLPAKDLVAAQAISKSFRALALLREAWEPRLDADFGLRVSVRLYTRRCTVCGSYEAPM